MKVPYQPIEEAERAVETYTPPGSPRTSRENYQGHSNRADYDTQAPIDIQDEGAQYHERRNSDDDDVMILPGGSIQNSDDQEDNVPVFCPPKQLLPCWPFYLGIFEILFGFLALGFGAIQLFMLPVLVAPCSSVWGLNQLNSYGMVMWSGVLLILSGSLAVRICTTKSLLNIQQFYVLTLFSCLCNAAFLMTMLYFYTRMQVIQATGDCSPLNLYGTWCGKITKEVCKQAIQQLQKYSWINMMSVLWCMSGFIPLVVTTIRYFKPVMFGHVNLLRSIVGCLFPWCCDDEPCPRTQADRNTKA